MNSIFEIFKIGIGPSSSHTVGPMKAAFEFVKSIDSTNTLSPTLILIPLCFSLFLEVHNNLTKFMLLFSLERRAFVDSLIGASTIKKLAFIATTIPCIASISLFTTNNH